MDAFRIANVADSQGGEAFVDLPSVNGRPVRWLPHSGLPRNAIERAVQRPRLARYRAAWEAAGERPRADILISHLPRMTAAVEQFALWRRTRSPHLAFSFNFTDLPEGRDLRRMIRLFADVERFCVYSTHERSLYSRLFGIPIDRFVRVSWAQPVPEMTTDAPAPDGPFVVAVGGEGRDFASVIAAARATPEITWLVISRPTALFDEAPSNLIARFNVPAPITWGLAARGAAVVVPLRSAETCCGQITIASAQLLGLPLITTRAMATDEYVSGMPGTIVIEPNDPDLLAAAARAAVADRSAGHGAAAQARPIALERYDRALWVRYVAEFAAAHA